MKVQLLLPPLLLGALLSSCGCGRVPVQTADGGDLLVEQSCVDTSDCPLGQACVDARCRTPDAPDASTPACHEDTDCPDGLRCLKSAGLCIPPPDAGVEPVDAGPTGDCFEGQVQSCGSSKLGECRLGTSTCALVDGAYVFGPCVGAVDATAETCNGKDDDCDGLVDDGLGDLSCGVGDCARTVAACVGGQSLTCTPGTPTAEICDGRDNDCNGQIDDGLPALSCGVGACARTGPSCDVGIPQLCVPGSAGTETCNGLDDDCDGTVDDGFGPVTCGLGVCRRSVASCVGGVPVACTPGDAGVETCNQLDDDCDGLTDEGCACVTGQTQPCYSGTPGTQGVGVCVGGTQSCVGGAWGACTGQVTDGVESCNGKDDDCNGQVDDGLGTSSCGVGVCAKTVAACTGGVPQTCTPGTPGTETCNGKDDDCDGVVDDGLGTLSCGVGACATTIAACASGVTQTCTPGPAGTETCNAVDDDCDGATDETFPQQGQACATSAAGKCATGTTACTAGALTCTQTVFPQSEICGNGLDEDCNGVVDDPSACGCSTAIDRDFDGANQCVDCNDLDGTIHPGATEVCNGKDDDCDGLRDEGFDVDGDGFTTCGTVAGGGVDPLRVDCNDTNAFVFPGKTADCGNAATPTTANGVDDNCNGYVDETCACSAQDKDKDGVTTCAGDCNDNDATVAPGRPEVCDGKDNDCNKATVDNCGVSDPCGTKQGASWTPYAAGTDRCRPDLVCVSNVATGALTCGSFCNQTTGLGLNDSCAANEGCFRNLIDSDNLHLCSVLTVGTKTTGQACTLDTECRTGDCLTDGTSYCSDKCTHEAGCSANTTCTIRKDPLTSGPFVIGYDYSSYCRLDANITGTKTTGQACTGSECRAGAEACVNGKCIEPCCNHADCGSGYACSIAGPKVATGYTTSGGASIVSIVPACLASTAVRVSGAACTANTDCRSGLCEKTKGICVDLCCNDGSCPNGTTCEPVSLTLTSGEKATVRACLFAPVPTSIDQK